MKYLIALFFGLLSATAFSNVSAQSVDTTDTRNIRWKDRKLTLDDFIVVGPKEKNPDSTHFGGHADVWVLQRTSSKGNQVRIHIVTYFNYTRSWIQKKEQKIKKY